MLIEIINKGSVPYYGSHVSNSTGVSLSDILFSFMLEKYIVCNVCGLRSPSIESSGVLYISPTHTSCVARCRTGALWDLRNRPINQVSLLLGIWQYITFPKIESVGLLMCNHCISTDEVTERLSLDEKFINRRRSLLPYIFTWHKRKKKHLFVHQFQVGRFWGEMPTGMQILNFINSALNEESTIFTWKEFKETNSERTIQNGLINSSTRLYWTVSYAWGDTHRPKTHFIA